MEGRKAFSFLRSFYEAAKKLPTKEDQADFLLAVCEYGLTGNPPEEMSALVAAMFELAKPNLDSSLAKAANGSAGGKANRKQNKANESKSEANLSNDEASESNNEAIKDKGDRIKDKGNKEKDKTEKENDFALFWEEYPKKKGRGAAEKAFEKALKKTDINTLLDAVKIQRNSDQWTRDNGQWIPYPATWLNQERWNDEPDPTPLENNITKSKHSWNDAQAGYSGVMNRLEGLIDDQD